MKEGYFKNKYRIDSTRLNNWNYSQSGFYFVTICTWRLECVFGNVEVGGSEGGLCENKEETCRGMSLQSDNDNVFVDLSPVGEIVKEEWLKTGVKRGNVELHDYIIMPNHFHAIIEIVSNEINNVETRRGASPSTLASTKHVKRQFSKPQKKSLSIIINQFKGAVTRECNLNNHSFIWQTRFYDHVIKDYEDLTRIKRYIKNNPKNWKTDRNNINFGECVWT